MKSRVLVNLMRPRTRRSNRHRKFYNLHTLGVEIGLKHLQSKLLNEDLSRDKTLAIIADIKQDDAFHSAHNPNDGILKSQFKRLKYFKQKLVYVEPRQIELGIMVQALRLFIITCK